MLPCVSSTASRQITRSPMRSNSCESALSKPGMSVFWAEANCGVATRTATAIRAPLKKLIMRTEQEKAGFRRILQIARAGANAGEQIADEKNRARCADDRAIRPRPRQRARRVGL